MAEEAADEGGEAVEPEPLPAVSGGLQWTILPSEVSEWHTLTHEEVKQRISTKLELGMAYTDFRSDIVSDFHLYNLVHTKSICLSDKQGALFMNIMLQVLNKMQSESKTCKYPGDSCQYDEVFDEFKRLLSAHCAPSQTRFFTLQEARLLIDFVTLTFFKHFLLYQYCLIFAREVEIIRADVMLESTHPPMPLNVARFAPKELPKATMVPTENSRAPQAEKKSEKDNSPLDPVLQEYLEKRIGETEEKLNTKIGAIEQKLVPGE